jgi:hypothetical protein
VGEPYLAVRTFSLRGCHQTSQSFSFAYNPLSQAADIVEKSAVDSEVAPYVDLDAAGRYRKKFGRLAGEDAAAIGLTAGSEVDNDIGASRRWASSTGSCSSVP